jgi:hypothetical protein
MKYDSVIDKLKERARIRRSIPREEPDRISEACEAAYAAIEELIAERDEFRELLSECITKIRSESYEEDPMAPFAYDREW